MSASVDNDAFFRFALDRGLLSDADVQRCRQVCEQTGRKAVDVVRGFDLLTASYTQLAAQTLAETVAFPDAPTKVEPPGGPPAASAPDTPLNQLPDDALVGHRLGRYQLLGLLGQGAMGVAYRAWDTALEREVALKIIRQQRQNHYEAQARFLREARAVAGMGRHPNIVSVLELGNQEDISYFTMELVVGLSMTEWLSRKRPSIREVLEVGLGITRGMAFAHDHGIIHRDLKPDNILINEDEGRPLITDFGLAREVEASLSLTVTGTVLGTPAYLAPEQAGDLKEITPSCDIYSLGVVLYEALAGSLPFPYTSTIELLVATLQQPPDPLRQRAPEVPSEIDAIVMRCLAKLPDKRPPSMNELGDQLQAWLTGRPLTAPWLGSPSQVSMKPTVTPPVPAPQRNAPRHPGQPLSVAPATPGATGDSATPPSRRPLAVAAGVLVALLAGAGWLLSQEDVAPTQPKPSASAAVSRPTALVTLTHPPANLVTNAPELSLEGDVQSGTLQSVWIQGAEVPVEDGSFFAAVTLSSGTQQLTVRDRQQGNELASLSVTLDRDPPKLSVTSPADEAMLVNDQTLTVQGTVRDDHLKDLHRPDGEVLTVEEDGRFSGTVILPKVDGRHQVVLTADDTAGNRTQATVTVVVDRTPPTIQLTAPGAVVAETRVTVQGRVEDAHPGKVWLNGRQVEVSPDGHFETTIDLQGETGKELRLEAEDALGQRSEPLIHSITLDQSPPVITVDAPTEGHSTNDLVLRVRGRVEDLHLPDSLTVNGMEASLDASGLFEAEISLQEGVNEISVECLDRAGNPAPVVRRTVTCDSTPPTIALPQDFPLVIMGQRPSLKVAGNLDEAGCTVQVNGKPAGVRGRSFSSTVRLQKGENRVEIEAHDQAGNMARLTHSIFYSRNWPKELKKEFKTAWWEPTGRQIGHALRTNQSLWFEDDLGIRFVLIPPGEFLMGSPENEVGRRKEETRHHVTLTRGFYMSATEVTNDQLKAWKPDFHTQLKWGENALDAPNQPATFVTVDQANEFCDWLTNRDGSRKDRQYRLPTEAEWEWACRGETTTRFYWGDDERLLADHANAGDAVTRSEFPDFRPDPGFDSLDALVNGPKDDGHRVTASVETFKSNPFGLYDMLGNVWEFCQDWAGAYPTEAVVDPRGPDTNEHGNRVMRGGGWCCGWSWCRPAARYIAIPAYGGIRLVVDRLDAKPASPSSSRGAGKRSSQPAGSEIETEWKPSREQKRYARKEKLEVERSGPLGMRFVLIPPGTFTMGSPPEEEFRLDLERQHRVVLTRGFYMAATEVTNAQFRRFKEGHDSGPDDQTLNDDKQPVVLVTWNQAREFCQWLTQEHGQGLTYRLPSDAEWEYACRAGTNTTQPWNGGLAKMHQHANTADHETKRTHRFEVWERLGKKVPEDEELAPGDDGYRFSAPVGQFPPNPWGLHDMIGNVFEWVRDSKRLFSGDAQTDPLVTNNKPDKIARGGSWRAGNSGSRSACRVSVEKTTILPGLGFRVVAEAPSGR